MRKIIFTMVMAGLMVVGLNAQALKVAADGNVGINQATPTSKLHVVSPDVFIGNMEGSGATARLKVNHTGTNAGLLFATGGTNRYSAAAFQSGGGLIDFTFYNDQNATASLLIDGNTNNADFAGTVSSMGVVLTSDKNLKKNIKEYSAGLDKVMQIKPITFQYNKKINKGMSDRTFIGVLAQEIAEIEPMVVNKYTHRPVDENMIPTGESEDYLQLQADAVQYMLVNAVQEQQEIIDEKEERILDLEDRLTELEDKIGQLINQTDVNLGGGLSDAGFGQNVPNPFNGETQIAYSIPEKATSASMNIFDMNGKLLKSIAISHTGKGQLNVSADQLPSGTYSYQLVVDNNIIGAKKMIKAN